MSEECATSQAIHGVEGQSNKALVGKTGQMLKDLIVKMSEIERNALDHVLGPLTESTKSKPGERYVLMTPSNTPTGLWASPAAIISAEPAREQQLRECPWKDRQSTRRSFCHAPANDEGGIKDKNKIRMNLETWLNMKKDSRSWVR